MTPIIYLHGFASSPASRKASFLAARLTARGHQVEIPDLAQGDFQHLTISSQMRVITSIVRGREVHLVGSSMGGYLAALFASRNPQVQRVALLAPAFGFLRRWPTTFGAERLEQWRETNSLSVFHYGDNAMRDLNFNIIRDGVYWEDEPSFQQPGLIYHGLRDDVVPPSASEDFAASRPNIRLHLLDSDHELGDVLETMEEGIANFFA